MVLERYIPTGNEMISLPDIRERDGAIMGVTFLHMGYKGMIEIRGDSNPDGSDENPLLKPFMMMDGREEPIVQLTWERLNYWIPCFKAKCGNLEISGTILAPVGERGFIYSLKVINRDVAAQEFKLGLRGCWSRTIHEINESKEINAAKYVYRSLWNDSLVFDLGDTVNIFSFAPIFEDQIELTYHQTELSSKKVDFTLGKSMLLAPGEESIVNFYWGFGFEEVGSTTAAKEMLRKGYQYELDATKNWLLKRLRLTGERDMDRILNTNLFFTFFFASGVTLDTEEFALVTSRSPRYYVSAAYWDRDSLLWSFPSILLVDSEYAKEMLSYAFSKQIKNAGVHSRYIDGTVLEPGFELDELCAPLLALYNYVKHTGDYEILSEESIKKGIARILTTLQSKKHPETDLYETFLQPTDDLNVYPYLTYDNVLVWRIFTNLAEIYANMKDEARSRSFFEKAGSVAEAIWKHCVVWHEGREIFAWSLDLKGNSNVYDEPPGSLQLLPFHGFCDAANPVYLNTVAEIRKPEYPYSFHGCNFAEIGCEHAPHPWMLSVANSLLCGRKEQCRDILLKASMDNGIACESIDENTGECVTGAAFATCAGFLAFAIYYAFGKKDTV